MTLFIFSTCIIFIKTFISLFINLFGISISLKVLLLISNFIILYYIYTYSKRQRRKLSGLRAIKYKFPTQYVLKTTWAHIRNIFILIIYPLIFIVGILWLRFTNTNRHVDLLYYYYELQKLIAITSITDNSLNILVLISIFILYITILRLGSKYVKFELIKRHIFLSQYDYYSLTIIPFLNKYINLNDISHYLSIKVSTIFYYLKIKKTSKENVTNLNMETRVVFDKTIAEKFITDMIYKLTYYYHHIILFLVILYDLIYNNFILEHMFAILPYIFIYEILVRICKFLQGLNIVADDMLYHFLYSPVTIIDEETYQVGSYPVATKDLYDMFKDYVYTDLNFDYIKHSPFHDKPQVHITYKERLKKSLNNCKKRLKIIYIDPLK